ncbi:MAG: hypothetical protein HYS27_02980 [Deltaproteobacteria bacterium]|nr:hypothetical protein [Deltaproteobacteria bacterium]
MPKVGKPMPAVNKAAVNIVNLLQESEASGPLKNNFRKSVRVVTWDGMQAMLKRNDITGGVKQAAEQAFVTLVGNEIRGRVDTSDLGKYYIKVDAKKWRSLENKLKGFFKTHNTATPRVLESSEERKLGVTAKKIAANYDKINRIDYSSVQGNRDQSKMCSSIMNVLFSSVAVADRGRVNATEIRQYFASSAGQKHSAQFKAATWDVFNYLRQSMRHEGWGWSGSASPPRDSMCIDEGERAFSKLMALKPGGKTYQAIERAAAIGH